MAQLGEIGATPLSQTGVEAIVTATCRQTSGLTDQIYFVEFLQSNAFSLRMWRYKLQFLLSASFYDYVLGQTILTGGFNLAFTAPYPLRARFWFLRPS